MKKFTLLIISIILSLASQAQDYKIDFTASGAITTLDSVHVINLTQQTELTLNGTDTLHLDKNTGIGEEHDEKNKISFYPNPLKNGEGKLRFYQKKSGDTKVEVYDIEGKLLLSKQGNLQRGHNEFMFTGMPTGFFMVHVKSASFSRSLKIISIDGKHGTPEMKFVQNVQKSSIQTISNIKLVKSVIGMQYNDGEPLKLTGYADSLVSVDTIIPTQSQIVDFHFSSASVPVADFSVSDTNIQIGDTINFTDQSTNNPTIWSWDFGDGNTSNVQHPVHVYDTAGTFTVSLTATNNAVSDTETRIDYIVVTDTSSANYPSGTVHCISGGADVVDVTNNTTGETWMDRNLGASQQATSSTDSQAYGDLYQWGRFSDGHQCRSSNTTNTNASTATPNNGNSWDGKFITPGSSPYDWLSSQNNNLWQGVNGINNPCPSGYRLPTSNELTNERQSWSSNNAAGAFNSPLKLPVAGYRYFGSGSLDDVGSSGYYWGSSVAGSYAYGLYFSSSSAGLSSFGRASGRSVRCLKD